MTRHLSVAPLLFVVVAALVVAGSLLRSAASPPAREDAVLGSQDGRDLYVEHCAACHGDRGFGDGDAAYLLYPKPRDFAAYQYRLVSTSNGVPTDQDLLDVISRGMLGSAMPPHEHLSEEQRRAIVKEVRRLTTEEGMKRLLEEAVANQETLSEADARDVAYRTPGNVVSPADRVPPTAELLAEGRMSYVRNCSLCHDLDGTGRTRTDLKDSKERALFARDFTAGIMKGGTSETDVWRRLRCGMPGTPMPALEVGDRETWALVHYVRSLIRPGAQERLAQKPRVIQAHRVEGPLSSDPAASTWGAVPSQWLSMTPLWWKEPRVEGILVQAVHDGSRLALRLIWEDASKDADQSRQTGFSDAAGVQWSAEEAPPFFAMGQKGKVVDIWYWRAAYQRQGQGFQDVAAAHPRVINDVDASLREPPYGRHDRHAKNSMQAYDPLYITAWGAGNPVSDRRRDGPVEVLQAGGFGTLTPREPPFSKVLGGARHEHGFWELVLLYPFPQKADGFALAPGSEASLAFAVWNGAARNRDGEKNVTIWHRLRVMR